MNPFRAPGAATRDWLLDASLATLCLVLLHLPFMAGLSLFATGISQDQMLFVAITGTGAYLAIILRRHYPLLFFFAVLLVCLMQLAFFEYPTDTWLLLPAGVFCVARWMPAGRALCSVWLSVVAILLAPIRWVVAAIALGGDLTLVMIMVAVAGGGAVTTCYSIARRLYDVDAARLRQKLAETDAAQLQIAEQAAQQRRIETEIRTSVARELHDVVAHSISVMVVQAEGGLAQVERSPATAQQALRTITETGRESLQEMRRIVRTLRSDSPTTPEGESATRLADISSLVDKSNATLTVSGTPRGSTPSIELTIVRVIQEALTNSLKHGGPAAEPHVAVLWFPTYVSVVVTNKLTGPSRGGDHRGTGIMGMLERVQALGGTLTVGPTGTGGYRVCAQIPLKTNPGPR